MTETRRVLAPQTSDLVRGFPFPFATDSYRYTTNVEPAGVAVSTAAGGQWGDRVVDIDSEYHSELHERAEILGRDPGRFAQLPHMGAAGWDAMLALMRELAQVYPNEMMLQRDGDEFHWHNTKLGWQHSFRVGNESTLPMPPLAYIAAQVQEDIVLLDHRDGDLFADAGVVTFAADWSFGFDVGMSFLEIHGPVPRLRALGVITRAREFLLRLQPDAVYRRTNWTLTVGRRLDVSTELYPEWGPDRPYVSTVDDDEFGRLVHLRVEVQHLIRLPESGAIMFLIRTYLLPLTDIAAVEPWRARTAAVLADLPPDMADYKGIASFRDRAITWLGAAAPATEV